MTTGAPLQDFESSSVLGVSGCEGHARLPGDARGRQHPSARRCSPPGYVPGADLDARAMSGQNPHTEHMKMSQNSMTHHIGARGSSPPRTRPLNNDSPWSATVQKPRSVLDVPGRRLENRRAGLEKLARLLALRGVTPRLVRSPPGPWEPLYIDHVHAGAYRLAYLDFLVGLQRPPGDPRVLTDPACPTLPRRLAVSVTPPG